MVLEMSGVEPATPDLHGIALSVLLVQSEKTGKLSDMTDKLLAVTQNNKLKCSLLEDQLTYNVEQPNSMLALIFPRFEVLHSFLEISHVITRKC